MEKVRLGDICVLHYGKSLTANKRINGNVPVYSSAGLIGYHNVPLVNNRGIIIGRKGTVGKVYKTDKPFYCIDTAFYILPDDDVYDFDYLYYCLKSLGLENLNEDSAVPGLNRETACSQLIYFPKIEIQKKIAKILLDIDLKIENNAKINDNLEKQVHALFRAWFVDFLPFDGQIPSNWRYVSFSDILTPRVEKSSDPSLQMFSVTDTGIHPRNEKFKKKLSMSGTKSKIIYQDDLVFGMSREILNWGVMRWPVGGVSSAYNVFSVCKDINTYYLETYMRSNIHYFKDLIRPASREGQGIDKNALMHKEILMPPENVLHSYYHHEDTLTRLIHNNIDENTRLSIIRYTLLPKLMFGEIDVSDIQL